MDVLCQGGGSFYFEPVLGTLNMLSEEKELHLRHIINTNCLRSLQSVPEAWFNFHSDSYWCQHNMHPVNTELEYKDFLHYRALVDKLLSNVLSASVASRTTCTLIWNSNFSLFSWIYDNRK